MGWQIAGTALIVLCICAMLAPKEAKGTTMYKVFSPIGVISFFTILLGLIIQIWQ
jgi:protein-S-isoprenylcysteine O-methyltransferase Ste14